MATALETHPRLSFQVRDACPADNGALVALAAACPMEGDIGLCVDRAPDFFALAALQGEDSRVAVAEDERGVIGCVGVAVRVAYLRGRPVRTLYVGDLKVHPVHRGGPVADALMRWARSACRESGGDEAPVLITVLSGNRAMERRTSGPRGLPRFQRLGTIRSHAVPLLWRRAPREDAGVRLEVARAEDLEEMAQLWASVAPCRHFAPLLDATALAAWTRAPGLNVSSYRVARRRNGRLAGFLALWDQHALKRLRVTAYSSRLAAVRLAFTALSPLAGAPRLPRPGGPLDYVTALHICVPADEPAVLRALLDGAYAELRGRYAFLNVGLDSVDPLAGALAGLLAQPTDVHAYVTTPGGEWREGPLQDRPLHYEISLV